MQVPHSGWLRDRGESKDSEVVLGAEVHNLPTNVWPM